MIKRYIAFCLVIVLACMMFFGCTVQAPSNTDTQYPVYETYTDIPGVTQEEIQAIERLKEKNTGFVLAMNHSTEAFYAADGEIEGYTSLFCGWLTDLFGISFTPDIVEWDALIEGLATYEIDFTGELTATPERLEYYYMTDAIAERSIKYFKLADSESLTVLASERTLRYAFLDGATSASYVRDVAGEAFTEVFVGDYEEAVQLLREGEIDAFFEDGSAEAAFDIYEDVAAAEYFPLIYTPVSLTTANSELKPVIDVVQKYLQQGAIYHLTRLYNEGESEYKKYKLHLHLSDAEIEYLREHEEGLSVPIALEYDNYPVSFYNETEQEWQGIAVDVLAEISELTGLAFSVTNTPQTTWPEILGMLETGEVALVSELIPSQEREGQFLWPEDPYSTDNFALVSLSEHESIKVNQILYSTVAVPIDTAFEEVFDKWFPNHQNVIRLPSTEECFAVVETGEADFVMASRNLMLSMTNYAENPGFKVNILFSATYSSSFGLHKSQDVLCSIISEAQKQVDTQSITEDWRHRVFDYRAKLARTQMPYLIGVAVLLAVVMGLLAVLLLRNKRAGRELERLVSARTHELEVQTKAAQQASNAKSDFLSHMSHEIRTPLNAIIGMAQVERQVPEMPPKALESNDKILKASHHLLGVLNDILDMAKIESGKFALVEEPFSLGGAVDEVIEIAQQRCNDKGLPLILETEGLSDKGIRGDKVRLKQVLVNILGNAVKFTDAGGEICFKVAVKSETAGDLTVDFEVRDTGIGMSEEQIARLFTAFEQTDDTVSVKYGGTGLGLAISQDMVHKMGGEIEVESRVGEGSRFYFTITFPKAELPPPVSADESVPDLRGRRILLAEDVDVNRIIIHELLDSTGVQIDDAADGAKALELFRESSEGYYGLVFMDVRMPKMDGYETTQAIRALERNDAKTIPIIAMTANAYKEDVEMALESGMNGHVAKPVDLNVIYALLRAYL